MELTIKRVHILNAIKFNNLVAGKWFEDANFYDSEDKVIKPNCTACLVGSTVKRAAKPRTVGDYWDLKSFLNRVTGKVGLVESDQIKSHLRTEHYLNALSAKFESTIREKARKKGIAEFKLDNDPKIARSIKLNKRETSALIKWVKDNIPTQFTVSDQA